VSREEVLETCKTRDWANVQLVHYASAIKAMDVADYMGVKLKEIQGVWQIVLVDRRKK
jgi:hypothetical protein